MDLVLIRDLVKRYKGQLAVDNISFSIAEGEIFGLLGPNGAGKSTTINAICGLIKYDRGQILVDGLDLNHNALEVKRRIGLVPQEIALFDNLSARENIEFFAKLAGLKGKLLKERVDEALDFVGLGGKSDGLPKSFSGGMKRRLNIACAISHHPRIIIMDEPTVGIDPQSRKHILESVKKLNHMGSTIIYTSHYMEEVEAVCNRIAIIDHGRLIACGSENELRNSVAGEEKILIDIQDVTFTSMQEITHLNGVSQAQVQGNLLEVITDNAQTILQDVLFVLSRNGVKIRGVKLEEPDLESVFLALTGRNLRN